MKRELEEWDRQKVLQGLETLLAKQQQELETLLGHALFSASRDRDTISFQRLIADLVVQVKPSETSE
jgi:hypothetical protein